MAETAEQKIMNHLEYIKECVLQGMTESEIAESFSNPSFRRVVAYLCFGGIARRLSEK